MSSVHQSGKTGLFSLLVSGVVAGVIPRPLAHRDRLPFPISGRAAKPFGGISVTTGLVLYLHTAWRFSDEGDGTPVPIDEPNRPMTGGIYARVRDPMSVAALPCTLGQAFVYRSVHVLWWAAAVRSASTTRSPASRNPTCGRRTVRRTKSNGERVPRWLPHRRGRDLSEAKRSCSTGT